MVTETGVFLSFPLSTPSKGQCPPVSPSGELWAGSLSGFPFLCSEQLDLEADTAPQRSRTGVPMPSPHSRSTSDLGVEGFPFPRLAGMGEMHSMTAFGPSSSMGQHRDPQP